MITLLLLFFSALAQKRDESPTFDPKIIQIISSSYEVLLQDMKQQDLDKSRAIGKIVISELVTYYSKLDSQKQNEVGRAAQNLSNTIERMGQARERQIQRDFASFISMSQMDQERVLTLTSQNLSAIVDSETQDLTSEIIIYNSEEIFKNYQRNPNKAFTSTWNLSRMKDDELQARVQELIELNKTETEIRREINQSFPNATIDQILRENYTFEQMQNQKLFFELLKPFNSVSNTGETQDITERVEYILREFEIFQNASTPKERILINNVIRDLPIAYGDLNSEEKKVIQQDYQYFLNLTKDEQEKLFTLITENFTKTLKQEPEKFKAKQLMLNFQDIIAAYKINPNQEINKSWDFPDETPIIAYNVTQRYEELRSEGKSNDEIKNILLTEVEQKFKATSQQDELVQTINQLTTAKDGDAQSQPVRDLTNDYLLYAFLGGGMIITVGTFFYCKRRNSLKKINAAYAYGTSVPE